MHRLTCIYAACKIEENHVSAEELGKGISQDHQMILNNEMIVYQAWMCHTFLCCFYFVSAFFVKYNILLSCRLWNLILSFMHRTAQLKDLSMIWR